MGKLEIELQEKLIRLLKGCLSAWTDYIEKKKDAH